MATKRELVLDRTQYLDHYLSLGASSEQLRVVIEGTEQELEQSDVSVGTAYNGSSEACV